jgi:molybdopterin/thiamine biosynthesis adenylyltransferase
MIKIDKSEFLTRQADLISDLQLKSYPITIIGAGAIGGWVALSLVKMGIKNITVMDYDEVDTVNMNCQFFRVKDIGKPKVLALQELIEDFTDVKINAINDKFVGGNIGGIVISAVDNMATRKLIYDTQLTTRFIIDPRMGAEDALMYVIKPNDMDDRESYEKVLYTDEKATHERCTAKATIYTANLLSGHVVKAVKNIITGETYPRITNWSISANQMMVWYAVVR